MPNIRISDKNQVISSTKLLSGPDKDGYVRTFTPSDKVSILSTGADYPIQDNDGYSTFIRTGGSAVLFTLPAAGANIGRKLFFKNTTRANLTIDAGASSIDGNPSLILPMENESCTLVSDGTNWNIIDIKLFEASDIDISGFISGTGAGSQNASGLTISYATANTVRRSLDGQWMVHINCKLNVPSASRTIMSVSQTFANDLSHGFSFLTGYFTNGAIGTYLGAAPTELVFVTPGVAHTTSVYYCTGEYRSTAIPAFL